MEMVLRPATSAERLYTYAQSAQLCSQTGCIGYLRGDMGESGKDFYTTWTDCRDDLKTPEFKGELDKVINALRFDEDLGGVLKSRTALGRFCHGQPESAFGNETQDFGFRANTEQFSYLFRLNPGQGMYNLYCYCYRWDWLDQHMKNAERGIRFITPDFRELFRIPDGDKVRIIASDGSFENLHCRYIDDYQMEIGFGWNSILHICQFAEQMKRDCSTVIPLRSSLPEKCFSFLEETGEMILLEKGKTGFQHTGQWVQGGYSPQEGANALNSLDGTTRAQEAAMKAGAFSGWASPEADPKNYDEQGNYIQPKQRGRER